MSGYTRITRDLGTEDEGDADLQCECGAQLEGARWTKNNGFVEVTHGCGSNNWVKMPGLAPGGTWTPPFPKPVDGLDVVGPAEIAARLGVARSTVDSWQRRGQLPPPWRVLSGTRVWQWPTIAAWAQETGRG